MKSLKEIYEILKTDNWDYAKFVQITSKLGGPKKSVLKLGMGFLGFGAVTMALGTAIGNNISNNGKNVNTQLSSEELQEIELYTDNYLKEREKMINRDEDVTQLDKEYNDFIGKFLNKIKQTNSSKE